MQRNDERSLSPEFRNLLAALDDLPDLPIADMEEFIKKRSRVEELPPVAMTLLLIAFAIYQRG